MNMIETVSIDIGYRYADFGKAKTKTFTGHDDVDNVNFTIYGKAKRVAMHPVHARRTLHVLTVTAILDIVDTAF